MYRPLQAGGGSNYQDITSLGAVRGKNLRELPQMLTAESAINIENYWIEAQGRLVKREGYDVVYTHPVSTSGVDAICDIGNGYVLIAFDTTVSVIDTSDWSLVSNLKTDFSAEITKIERYGDYAFVANGEDKLWRTSKKLNYDGQVNNFTVGATIQGGTSGATAIILEDDDSGVSGTLTLGNIVGVFEDNEALTTIAGAASGDGVVDGTLYFGIEEVTDSPRAAVIRVIGNRLYAGKIKDKPFILAYSAVDDGSNPPFDNWASGTTATLGGELYYRGVGVINGIQSFDRLIVVFGSTGRYAFTIDVTDSAGTVIKVENVQWWEEGLGGSGASEITEYGLFYTDDRGVRVLENIGQSDIKYSSREVLLTDVLSDRYMNKFEFDESQIVYDGKRELIYVLCKKESSFNNHILVFHPKTRGWTEYTGLNFRQIVKINNVFHAALSNSTKIAEVFNGQESDDGLPIYTEYLQEIGNKGLYSYSTTKEMYIEGWLHPESSISICFDKWDYTNTYIEQFKCVTWTPDSVDSGDGEGIGGAIGGAIGGSGADESLVETYTNLYQNFAGRRLSIRRYKRLRIKITSNSIHPHVISWYTIISKQVGKIRRRNLT